MDDIYLCGVRWGGQAGPGCTRQDAPFVAAVSTSPQGRPRKVDLAPVKGFRKREIARFAKRHFDAGTRTITAGLNCWTVLDRTGDAPRAPQEG